MVDFQVPRLVVVGQVGQELVRDMGFEEYHSAEKKFLATVCNGKVLGVQTFDEFKFPYNPEDLLRVIECLKVI
jgi:hypothetical protein